MTERMTQLLRVLAATDESLPPNVIATEMGLDGVHGGRGMGGRGRGARFFGPAQRIIFPLNRLRALGLIDFERRPDGKSGTAYYITEAGRKEIGMTEQAEGVRTDLGDAPGDAEAVWTVEGYTDHDNLDPVKAADVSFAPGTQVMFPEEHEVYGGETGTVMAVGRGRGAFGGEVTYDVRAEGTDGAERVTEHDLEAA